MTSDKPEMNVISLSTELSLFPPWRQALIDFRKAGFKHGDVVELDWLWERFALARPVDTTPFGIAQKAQLEFLTQFDAFRIALLVEDRMALNNIRSIGYVIVPAAEQTTWAEEESTREIRKTLRRAGQRLIYVDREMLTDQQRKENADALARLANREAMLRSDDIRGRRRLLK